MTALNKQALLSTDKHANQHMLSRLIVEANSAEIRDIAEAVEQYTDRLIAALEDAEKRIAELESRTVTVKLPELCVGVVQDGHAVMVPYAAGHWFNKTAILEMLAAAGIGVKGE